VLDKTRFSMVIPSVLSHINTLGIKSVVLFGIEAHICILQTSLDLVSQGYDVHVVADGTSSQNDSDRKLAFKRMQQAGVFISSYESILFQLMEDSTLPAFKQMSKEVIQTPRVDSGL